VRDFGGGQYSATLEISDIAPHGSRLQSADKSQVPIAESTQITMHIRSIWRTEKCVVPPDLASRAIRRAREILGKEFLVDDRALAESAEWNYFAVPRQDISN
jgi:hypothetical protein